MTATGTKPRILCVDDEPNVLKGLARQLRRQFAVTTTDDPVGVSDLMRDEGPFAVIMSDMRMPVMNGAQVLARAREEFPETIRLLLTGQSGVEAAASAVNEGQIFRFLRKPCPTDELVAALNLAVEQHRLVSSERVLLEETLKGSVAALVETLSAASPEVFGRAERVRQRVSKILDTLEDVENRWAIDVAVTLSQLPLITLPPATLDKINNGKPLAESEKLMVAKLPALGESLVAKIPRMELVQEVIRYHGKGYDGSGMPADGVHGVDLPLGARVLRLALDYEQLDSMGRSRAAIFKVLRSRTGTYDPELIDVLDQSSEHSQAVAEIRFGQLKVGMVLAADVQTTSGLVVLARGHMVTPPLKARLTNFAEGVGLVEPLLVLA